MKIRRKCKCGCGDITNYGKKYIYGHHIITKETRKKMALSMIDNAHGKGNKGKKHTKESKLKMSLSAKKLSKEVIFKRSLSQLKYNPNYEYCDAWKDRKYRKDLRKNYCENINCKSNFNWLNNHHINLNKKDCRPINMITLCVSCHTTLHNKLRGGVKKKASQVNYIIINRPDRVSYINKLTKKIIKIKREWPT